MKPVVATFAERDRASSAAGCLRAIYGVPPPDIGLATAAAYGEPYDGHALVAAWVADDVEEAVSRMLATAGGELHPQPWTARPDPGQ